MKTTIIKSGNDFTLTCVVDGEVISGQITAETASRQDLKTLNKEQIKNLFIGKSKGSDYVNYNEFIAKLEEWNHPLLEYVNSRIQYKGIPLAIPEFLCRHMAAAETLDELSALCNFWRNLALCPEPRVREGLFEYLTNNGFIITKQGLIVSLRRVHKASVVNAFKDEYVEAVTNSYFTVKRRKKAARHYVVVENEDGDYVMRSVIEDDVTNLDVQYAQLHDRKEEESTHYYANHQANEFFTIDGVEKYGRVEYHILKETRLSRHVCDHDSTRHCSSGLHLGTPEYVKENQWLGNTILVCLSNPMDAVSVPEDGYVKFRTAALYPIAVISESDVDNFTADAENTVEVFDEDYLNYTTDYIDALIQTTRFESLKEDFIIPREFNANTVYNIIDEIKKVTLKRIN